MKKKNVRDGPTRARELYKMLDKQARNVLRRACKIYDESELQDYDKVKDELMQLFVTTRICQRETVLSFYNRVQKPDESIHRYHIELSELASVAFPSCEKKMLDKYIYNQFLYMDYIIRELGIN